ncbi:MAG: polyprenyl synthetase family protein [Chloroflexota bacterium]
MELNEIYAPVQADLDKVKDELKSISRVDFPWLSEQLEHVVKGVGKGIRPALTLLSGKFHHYDLEYLLPMAVSVELMHTSTLVHDDAIDKSSVRRGQPTINFLWGQDIAILLGDYLFAKAGEYVSDTRNPRAIKLFSQTLGIISSGEINQFRAAFNPDQTRDAYLKRIGGKTASLFALSTGSGAILTKAPESAIAILRDYGYHLGIAFQIVDDILDFIGTEDTLGKPVGSDLAQGTLTLPAMLLLEKYPGPGNPVRKSFTEKSSAYIAEAIDRIKNSSIVDECYRVASEYCDKACRDLGSLPESPAGPLLRELADYVLRRRI